MSDSRRSRRSRRPRRLAALALASAPVLTLVSPAAAATPLPSSGSAGYVATGSTYTSVSATWIQPAINCTAGNQYTSFWVGLDGYTSSSVEQSGTEVTCAGTTPEYSAFYEIYPSAPVFYVNAVKPGDKVTASVAFSGTSTYVFTITDATQGWSRTATKTAGGLTRSSAEIVVDTSDPATLPGPGFRTVTFSGCAVNGKPLGSADPSAVESPGLVVSPITDGTNFSVTAAVSAN